MGQTTDITDHVNLDLENNNVGNSVSAKFNASSAGCYESITIIGNDAP
jgi:hypothetical protein